MCTGSFRKRWLEQRFWENFIRVIEAPLLLDDGRDPQGTTRAVAEIIATRTAADWERRFAGLDVCVVVVRSLQEAVENPHFVERGLFQRIVQQGALRIPALPTPIAAAFLAAGDEDGSYPRLGADNHDVLATNRR